MAVVWAEPSKGGLNFPVYPPTLNITSDPNRFTVRHQLQHMYDGEFPKPLQCRGPFKHRFNSYALSDIRFGEQETLDWLKGMESQRENLDDGNLFRRRHANVPEQPITVTFGDKGPTITIAGETRRYSELEMVQYEGGRQRVIDYEPVKAGRQTVSLPMRISVFSGDGKRVLRSARLCNYAEYQANAVQVAEEARQFSGFDADDMACRELLLKYWMKGSREVAQADVNALHALRARFGEAPAADASLGERLKRVNTHLQLDWMLADPNRLEMDFREYLSLLSANNLDRMILFGGQNVIETTVRWGQLRAGDRLLARVAGRRDRAERSGFAVGLCLSAVLPAGSSGLLPSLWRDSRQLPASPPIGGLSRRHIAAVPCRESTRW